VIIVVFLDCRLASVLGSNFELNRINLNRVSSLAGVSLHSRSESNSPTTNRVLFSDFLGIKTKQGLVPDPNRVRDRWFPSSSSTLVLGFESSHTFSDFLGSGTNPSLVLDPNRVLSVYRDAKRNETKRNKGRLGRIDLKPAVDPRWSNQGLPLYLVAIFNPPVNTKQLNSEFSGLRFDYWFDAEGNLLQSPVVIRVFWCQY